MSIFRNEEKLVALVEYSSFKRLAISMLQKFSVFIRSGSQVSQFERNKAVKTDSLCIQFSITVQHSRWNDCDVTGLVATEDVRNKYSLLESFSLLNNHAASSPIIINGTESTASLAFATVN